MQFKYLMLKQEPSIPAENSLPAAAPASADLHPSPASRLDSSEEINLPPRSTFESLASVDRPVHILSAASPRNITHEFEQYQGSALALSGTTDQTETAQHIRQDNPPAAMTTPLEPRLHSRTPTHLIIDWEGVDVTEENTINFIRSLKRYAAKHGRKNPEMTAYLHREAHVAYHLLLSMHVSRVSFDDQNHRDSLILDKIMNISAGESIIFVSGRPNFYDNLSSQAQKGCSILLVYNHTTPLDKRTNPLWVDSCNFVDLPKKDPKPRPFKHECSSCIEYTGESFPHPAKDCLRPLNIYNLNFIDLPKIESGVKADHKENNLVTYAQDLFQSLRTEYGLEFTPIAPEQFIHQEISKIFTTLKLTKLRMDTPKEKENAIRSYLDCTAACNNAALFLMKDGKDVINAKRYLEFALICCSLVNQLSGKDHFSALYLPVIKFNYFLLATRALCQEKVRVRFAEWRKIVHILHKFLVELKADIASLQKKITKNKINPPSHYNPLDKPLDAPLYTHLEDLLKEEALPALLASLRYSLAKLHVAYKKELDLKAPLPTPLPAASSPVRPGELSNAYEQQLTLQGRVLPSVPESAVISPFPYGMWRASPSPMPSQPFIAAPNFADTPENIHLTISFVKRTIDDFRCLSWTNDDIFRWLSTMPIRTLRALAPTIKSMQLDMEGLIAFANKQEGLNAAQSSALKKILDDLLASDWNNSQVFDYFSKHPSCFVKNFASTIQANQWNMRALKSLSVEELSNAHEQQLEKEGRLPQTTTVPSLSSAKPAASPFIFFASDDSSVFAKLSKAIDILTKEVISNKSSLVSPHDKQNIQVIVNVFESEKKDMNEEKALKLSAFFVAMSLSGSGKALKQQVSSLLIKVKPLLSGACLIDAMELLTQDMPQAAASVERAIKPLEEKEVREFIANDILAPTPLINRFP